MRQHNSRFVTMLHCISFHHSPEERCTSETFGGTKFCVFHLKSLPKKSYKNIDDIDVEMNVEELNLSSVLLAYKKSQKVIIARTLFMEKHVCLEARDFGHHRRISLLMDFHQRCDAKLESLVRNTEQPGSVSNENFTEIRPQILRDIRRSFVATKKKINDWKLVIDSIKKERKHLDEAKEIIKMAKADSLSPLSDMDYFPFLTKLVFRLFKCMKEITSFNRTLRCFWYDSSDDSWKIDPESIRYERITFAVISGCVFDSGINFDRREPPIITLQNINLNKVEVIRNMNVWILMKDLSRSRRVLVLNTTLKTGYRAYINFKYTFFISVFLVDNTVSHFTIFVRKDNGWDVEKVESKDIPEGKICFSDYLTPKSKAMALADDPKAVYLSMDDPWIEVINESRKLVKRIIIASKLGKKGENIIEADVEKYNEFRKIAFS